MLRFPLTNSLFLALPILPMLLGACGSSVEGTPNGPCEADPPPAECGAECVGNDDCSAGFYCGDDGSCTADCMGTSGCEDDQVCNPSGICVPADDGCPDINVDLAPVTPTVVLLIDHSSSMTTSGFGSFNTRWEAVEDALVNADTGVLWDLESKIILGASLYSSDNGDDGGTCPMLNAIAPALDNAQEIGDLIANNVPPPGDNLDTPTAESLTATAMSFPDGENRVIVLATDGDPDTCADPDSNGQDGPRQASEMATQGAFDLGIATFVLSVGSDAALDHLNRVARAGRGQDLDSGTATAYVANDPDELVDAFNEIIRGVRTCQIEVDGTVQLDRASEGTVVLNGEALEHGVDWQMVDEDTMELIGEACETYLNTDTVTLAANFPCGGVVVD